ncbi:hypothetical protein PVK06_047611 [Gossypium arboreum]|uniref:Uncharacterized protein n=1 Tax=Gossypium arboreum TaxID=29729 RepID=A0ABR0MEA0_GOSAR|nr:hypothetical protein PVK06_047611 [Gossypium arboreum]
MWKNLYRGASTYIGSQSSVDFIKHLGYRRTDDLLPIIRSDEDTLNALVDDDNEGTDLEKDLDPQFRAYEPLPHMTNINLSAKGGLEFRQLPHRALGHASSSSDVQVLEIGMEYPNKDAFLTSLKQYNFKNGVSYHVIKYHSEKFEGKREMYDGSLWMIKKYYDPYTCVAAVVKETYFLLATSFPKRYVTYVGKIAGV